MPLLGSATLNCSRCEWVNECVCKCCPVTDCPPLLGVIVPHTQCLQDSHWINHDADQDKAVTKEE